MERNVASYTEMQARDIRGMAAATYTRRDRAIAAFYTKADQAGLMEATAWKMPGVAQTLGQVEMADRLYTGHDDAKVVEVAKAILDSFIMRMEMEHPGSNASSSTIRNALELDRTRGRAEFISGLAHVLKDWS